MIFGLNRFGRNVHHRAAGQDLAVSGGKEFRLLKREEIEVVFPQQRLSRQADQFFSRLIELDEAQLLSVF